MAPARSRWRPGPSTWCVARIAEQTQNKRAPSSQRPNRAALQATTLVSTKQQPSWVARAAKPAVRGAHVCAPTRTLARSLAWAGMRTHTRAPLHALQDDDEEPVYYPRSASSSPSTPAAAAAEPVHVPPEPQAAATSAAAAPAAPPASSSSNSFETSVDDYKVRKRPRLSTRGRGMPCAEAQQCGRQLTCHTLLSARDPPSWHMCTPALQAALLDSFYGIERGLTARSEVRAEINELISSLEAKNPMPNPTEVRMACRSLGRGQ